MARNIPAIVIATMAGAVVSMSSGFLVASYVTSGLTPIQEIARRAPMVRTPDLPFVDDRWAAPVYDQPQIGVSVQPGVRASGSSRL